MLTNFERVLDEWIEQKLAEGRAEGRAEGLEQVAKEMLASDMPLEQIMRFTKLSREKLEHLKKDQ